MLLLSGVRDQVVPREHMQTLWGIVGRRQGTPIEGSSEEGEASQGSKQVAEGKSKFLEFERGTHSE